MSASESPRMATTCPVARCAAKRPWTSRVGGVALDGHAETGPTVLEVERLVDSHLALPALGVQLDVGEVRGRRPVAQVGAVPWPGELVEPTPGGVLVVDVEELVAAQAIATALPDHEHVVVERVVADGELAQAGVLGDREKSQRDGGIGDHLGRAAHSQDRRLQALRLPERCVPVVDVNDVCGEDLVEAVPGLRPEHLLEGGIEPQRHGPGRDAARAPLALRRGRRRGGSARRRARHHRGRRW